MKKLMTTLVTLAYLVSWKAVGMGDKKCDYDEYTGAETHCEKIDVSHEKWFNTKEGAQEFIDKAPSRGIKDMKVEQKEKSELLTYSGSNLIWRGN